MQRVDDRASDAVRAFEPGAEPLLDENGRPETSYPTLDPLSVAPPDRAYFVARGAGGDLHYTREGSLTLRDGTLRTRSGAAVLGVDRSGRLAPIALDRVDRALGRVSDPRIDPRGDVLYDRRVVDPRSGNAERRTVVAGRIALARFPAGTRLRSDGEAAAAPGVVPHYGMPADGSFPPLETMRRESSGIDIDGSLDRLRYAYRELDAMEAAYRAQYGTYKTAMDVVK